MKAEVPADRRLLPEIAAALPLAAAWAAVARLLSIEFVDQRYQSLLQPERPPEWAWPVAALLLAGVYFGARELLRRRGDGRRAVGTGLLLAFLPLTALTPFWYFRLGYSCVFLCVLCFALAAGRLFSQLRSDPEPGDGEALFRRAPWALAALILVCALWGAMQQYRSYTLLGMQWLDWGHYYESLLNTWRGRFFHLNISHGCFLGSRFCPSLLVLSPVLLAGVPGFFFAGALLVASGAYPVYLTARRFGATPAESLLFGVWYLVLPGVVNLELPLLDGFHEVFLLFPTVLWAFWAYLGKRYKLACALVLFAFGVRETVPFMFLGAGVTLFLVGRKRHGAILAATSLLALVLILGVLMPLARRAGTTYDHVVFYPHLGNTVWEIAWSPVLRFKAFWGAVFSAHSWRFYAALFLPFVFLAAAAPVWWLPMIFDLAMVAADRRFDSQTLLRHYQCVMLLTLVIAALEGFRKLRSGAVPRYARWILSGLPGADPVGGMLAATLAATLGMTCFFTQAPGLPGADPRLEKWSDARPAADGFIRLVEPGAPVTAGPRLASLLVGRNDVYLSSDAAEPLKRYVLVEGLNPDYRQKKLRGELLKDSGWTLLRSEFLEDRKMLVQLFEHRPRTSPPPPAGVRRLTDAQWLACGDRIPSPLPQLEMRGQLAELRGRGLLIVSARLAGKVDFDLGFTVRLEFFDAPATENFVSFGDGLLPADSAAPGDVYTFAVPVAGRIRSCLVELHVIGDRGQEL